MLTIERPSGYRVIIMHGGSKKLHRFIIAVTLLNVNQFSYFWHMYAKGNV